MGRSAPKPRIPKHFEQGVVSSHRGLVGEPNQCSRQGCQYESILAHSPRHCCTHTENHIVSPRECIKGKSKVKGQKSKVKSVSSREASSLPPPPAPQIAVLAHSISS